MEFDEDRFFSGASRGDYLDALTAHAGLGSVVVIEGETGSGVSTLLGQAVMALLDDLELVRIDGSDEHDANVVVDALLRHFSIERSELPETLRRTLVDGRILVVVDNSEHLSAEALATMASLKQKLAGRLGYFFAGVPGVVDQVKAAGFTVDDVLGLPALAAEDVQDLAWFVLGLELDEAESQAQCERTAGNLGALLASLSQEGGPVAAGAAEESLSFSAREPDEDFDEPDADDDYQDDEVEDEPVDKAAPPWRHIAAVAGLLVVVVLLWIALTAEPDDESASRAIALPVPEGSSNDPVQEQASEGDAVQPMAPTMEPVARLEDLQAREAESASREDGNVILAPVSDPVMQSDPPPRDTVMTLPDASSSETVEPEPAPQEQKPVAQSQSAPLVDAQGYRHAGWLATVDDSRWFLQVVATSQQEGAQQVLDQVARKGAYYKAERNGKKVWLVLAGDYSSRQAAVDAKSSLPANLQKAGPFPRKMADIRSEL